MTILNAHSYDLTGMKAGARTPSSGLLQVHAVGFGDPDLRSVAAVALPGTIGLLYVQIQY